MTAAEVQREDIDKLMSLTVVYLTQGAPGALGEQRNLVLGAITSLAKRIADREKPVENPVVKPVAIKPKPVCARDGCGHSGEPTHWMHDRKDWLRTGLHHNFYSGTRFER